VPAVGPLTSAVGDWFAGDGVEIVTAREAEAEAPCPSETVSVTE